MITRVSIAVSGVIALAAISSAQPPASVFDLNRWKLTLPYDTARAGNPDEVLHPELARFADPNAFFVSPQGDAIIFRAACGGLGTINSRYPRSELREMAPGGADEAHWDTDKGSHQLDVDLAVTHLPDVKRHVVCTQIHDKDDDLLMIRLEKKKLFVERNDLPDVSLDSNYQLGQRFRLQIITENDHVRVKYNGQLKLDWPVSGQGCYFKAGCYTQSNASKGDRPEAYGEVTLFRLKLTHRGE